MTVVEVAHSRHETNFASFETRRAENGTEISDRVHDRGHSSSLGVDADEASVLAAFDSTRYNGRSDSSSACRWRSTVSTSPRAAGPVSARATPRASTLSTDARINGRNAANGTPAPAASRSTWPSRTTKWFEATDAAAW